MTHSSLMQWCYLFASSPLDFRRSKSATYSMSPVCNSSYSTLRVCTTLWAKKTCLFNSYRVATGHKVGEKKFPEFSRAVYLLFHRLLKHRSFTRQLATTNSALYFSWHLLGRVATPRDCSDTVYPLVTQSAAALRKYLNDTLKILCLLQFLPEVAQNSPSFPCSEKSLSIPGFPGLWPPCLSITLANEDQLWQWGTTVQQQIWDEGADFMPAIFKQFTSNCNSERTTKISAHLPKLLQRQKCHGFLCLRVFNNSHTVQMLQ